MDYVYICRPGENEELRYSIRSVIANAPEGRVWLIGSKPDWYVGNFIPVKDKFGKFENIRQCQIAAAKSDDISDDFVLMNDDFFIVRKLLGVPTLCGSLLKDRVDEYRLLTGGSSYVTLLHQTMMYLKRQGTKDPIDYDIHVPMVFNKTKLRSIVDQSLSIRSLYGNTFAIGGEQINDVKSYKDRRFESRSYDYIAGSSPYLSTEDDSFALAYEHVLKDMFPDPSPYEA